METVARSCSIKKGFVKIFAKFTGNYLCRNLIFFKKGRLKEREKKSGSGPDAFLLVLQKFYSGVPL